MTGAATLPIHHHPLIVLMCVAFDHSFHPTHFWYPTPESPIQTVAQKRERKSANTTTRWDNGPPRRSSTGDGGVSGRKEGLSRVVRRVLYSREKYISNSEQSEKSVYRTTECNKSFSLAHFALVFVLINSGKSQLNVRCIYSDRGIKGGDATSKARQSRHLLTCHMSQKRPVSPEASRTPFQGACPTLASQPLLLMTISRTYRCYILFMHTTHGPPHYYEARRSHPAKLSRAKPARQEYERQPQR
jgi:hypothetical protein